MVKYRVNGYYNDFEVFKMEIQKLINKLNRFPTQREILNELKIGQQYIKKHGGMYEIKRKMNYNDSHDLVDKSGFFNKSVYELIVANFLIENNISYLREQTISNDHNFRSDFTFVTDKEELIHVELWGYLKTNKTKIAVEYNKVRKEKETLYKQLGINYISIEPSIFYKMNYNKIQKSLTEIFSHIFSQHKFKLVNQDLFIPGNEYSDDEILNTLMSLSDNNDYLPEACLFREKYRTLYNQILKRYGNYSNFADKYNKKLKYKSNKYWTEDKIFKTFDYMIENYNKILSRRDSKNHLDDIIVSDYAKVSYSFRVKDLKLKYYSIKISNKDFVIPQNDLKWIKQVKTNLSRRCNIPYTSKQQEQADKILEKYNARTITPTS